MEAIIVWGQHIPEAWLSPDSRKYLCSLPPTLPPVEWVWEEMDRVWNFYALDNQLPLSSQDVGQFYAHPVWLMNGIFTQLDPTSAQYRQMLAKYLAKTGLHHFADYGGGFGELALAITSANPDATVSIIEPYPSSAGLERLKQKPGINFSAELPPSKFEAITVQDVLEHVEDPIKLAWQIAGAVKEEGLVIFANCFRPFILCHLPTTFHLQHTFKGIMQTMGLNFIGIVEGAPHAQIFRRKGALNLNRARNAEMISKSLHPLPNKIYTLLSNIKQTFILK
ncbi:MAG: methyltransferase domain-containing protein [Pseudomonadales bacterium]|nr:methyltransferase domain-containing protein [Pseudomonadales bacterium]